MMQVSSLSCVDGALKILAACSALALAADAQGQVRVVDDGALAYGAYWMVDLNASGTIETKQEISQRAGTFPGELVDNARLGSALAALGDLDGDGTPDLAVGAPGTDFGASASGEVWIVFGAPGGGVRSARALRAGGWNVPLEEGARFGSALAALGDLDGDGWPELAVGAEGSSASRGDVWILSLGSDGSVTRAVHIDEADGGFGGALDLGDRFGGALVRWGDLDGDGVPELFVGAPEDGDGGFRSGAAWLLFLAADGRVKSELKISATSGGFGGPSVGEALGSSLARIGDLDGDGAAELALGAPLSDDGGADKGAVWVLYLNPDGSVRAQQKISATQGGLGTFPGTQLGGSVAPVGDLNADGSPDMAVGAPGTGTQAAFFVLFLAANGTVLSSVRNLPSTTSGDLTACSLATLGDLDLDGRPDLAVGAKGRRGTSTADFTTVQAAVDAAVDDDVILIRHGRYAGFTVDGKALTIAGDPGARIFGAVRLKNVPAGDSLRLSRLIFEYQLELLDDAGLVWLEDCSRHTPDDDLFYCPGILVQDCHDVVLISSRFDAGVRTIFDPNIYLAAPGASVTRSTLQAYDCVLTGAESALYDCAFPYDCPQIGGAGVEADASSFVFLSGCSAQGGAGDGFYNFLQPVCAPGGIGINTAATAVVVDSEIHGGPGPVLSSLQCAPDGLDSMGDVRVQRVSKLRFTALSPLRDGEPSVLDFDGPPGSPVWLIRSAAPNALYMPIAHGVVLEAAPRTLEFVGYTDLHGRLTSTRARAPLPPGVQSRTTFLQAFCSDLHPDGAAAGTAKHRAFPSERILGSGAMLLELAPPF